VKLKDARDAYYTYSGKLSDIVRQLSFAGIAVIWIFRASSENGGIVFQAVLIWPLLFLVVALALDLLHYLYGSIAWSLFAHCADKKGKRDEDEVEPHESINWPSNVFFYSKAAFCVIAYILLIMFLKGKI
jgi:hypothetical protein